MKLIIRRALSVLTAGLLASAAYAVDGTWTGAVDGVWSTSANWLSGTVASNAGYVATLSNLAGPIQITNDVASLKLKGLVAQGGAYTVYGQPLTLEGTATGNYGLIVSNGMHTVGSTVNLNADTQIYVANSASLTTTGLLDYLGNTTLSKAGPGEWIFKGRCAETNASSANFYILEGTLRVASGAVLTRSGGTRENFLIGNGALPGRVVVEKGAALNLGGFSVGRQSGSSLNTLFVNGGTLTADSSAYGGTIVAHSAPATMSVSNNAVVAIDFWLSVGLAKRGELNIGGNSDMSVGQLSMGVVDGVDFSSAWNGPSFVTVGSGRLAVTNRFFWCSNGNAARTNLVTVGDGLAGGATLRLPATTRSTGNPSFARLAVNGGVLELVGVKNAGNSEALTNYFYGLNQIWIGTAGAVVDTTNNTVTVTQRIERDPSVGTDGGLTKRGTGRLTLAGGCTYAGPTAVEQGSLRLQGVLPTNGVAVVKPGATLSLVDGQFRTFAPQKLTVGQGDEASVELEAGLGSASDSLTLTGRSKLENVAFALVGVNGTASYWQPGDYVVATYAGSDPNVSGWHTTALPTGVSATFEVLSAQKRVVLHVAGAATGTSVWIAPGSGAWATASNWNTAPANDPATRVLFGDALLGASQITLGASATLGGLTLNTPYACSLGGAGLTFGAAGVGGTLAVQQGSHVITSALTVPTNLAVTVQTGATVLLGGSVTGGGRVAVAGGGTLAITNGAAFDVPMTVDGVTLSVPQTTEFDTAFELGAGGVTLVPATGKTVTFSGGVGGTGALTKDGASIAVLSGVNSGTGTRTVKNGTLALSSLTDGGDLVLGEGTLKYTGADVTTSKGLTIRTTNAKLGATFAADADVTFNGNIRTDNGVFIKSGKGTVTFAATGNNQFGSGQGSDTFSVIMTFGPYGESPTNGLRVFQVIEGKMILGVEGQTNLFPQTVIVGGETTTNANAEKAAAMEINGGFTTVTGGTLMIGRGNGSAVTAPTGLVSSVRLNGGTLQLVQLWLGARLNDMATITARPLFEMNGGLFSSGLLYCGTDGTSRPRLVFNGGYASFTGPNAGDVCLSKGAGVTGEVVVAGGTLAVSNSLIRMAENAAGAKGTMRLNSGRLITRGFERLGSGAGDLYLNGGVLQPCQSLTLSNLSAAVVQTGGFATDVPAGMTLTVVQALSHDEALAGNPDGGVVKSGAGTLELTGTEAYTGPTFVSGGVLRVAGSLAVTNLTLAGGTTLSLTNGAYQVFAPSGFAAGDAGGAARVEMDIAADGSAYDVLALPGGVGGKLTLCLYKTGTAARFVSPGRYPLVTFTGTAPVTAGWAVEGMAGTAVLETDGTTVYVRIGTGVVTAGMSAWTNALGGAWSAAGNWLTAPANDASANVLFGNAISSPATVTTVGGATFSYMAVDSAVSYTWNGGAMTLGSAESNASVRVTQGSHTVDADVAAPSAAALLLDGGATLQINGAVTGAGSLAVSGGGTMVLTNGPACDVPVTLDNVTLVTTLSTVFDTPFTLGAGGAVFTPANSSTVTVTSEISGAGGLTKRGSSFLTLDGANTFAGEAVVRNGTLSLDAEPAGPLVIGEGTLKYTGPNAAFTRGYTLRTTANSQPATLDSDADIVINGQIKAGSGAFIKLGSGTLTYAYAGENTLSAGDNPGTSRLLLNRQPYGDAPTQGYRSFNIYNGKVVLGVAGQTNRFLGGVVIGGQSTTNADAETAAHMEINGGVNICDETVIIGRGNGSAITAPAGLVSSLTINGGENLFPTVRLADTLDDMTTLTARPLLTLNNGALRTGNFYCGYAGGTPKPRIVINGGVMTVGTNSEMILANSVGCVTEMELNGGTVVLTNQALRLASNQTGAQGTLNLNGGRLVANTIYQDGATGLGIVNFNGGVFQPTATRTMSGLTAATNRLGGAIFDVPTGIIYTVAQTLLHDEGLGGTPDGGLVKLGAGTLVLAATNTYTGPTVVSNGTLNVSNVVSVTSALTAAPGGTLSLTVPVAKMLTVPSLTLGEAAGNEAGLILTADRAGFVTGVVAVAGDLFLGKTAVTVQIRETGAAPTNGTYVVLTCAGTISGDAANLRLANGAFGKGYTFAVVDSRTLCLTVGLATADAVVWKQATGGDWATAENWVTAPGAGAAGMTVGFLDSITAPASVNVADGVTAGALRFNSANAYTLSGSGSLALSATNGPATVTVEQGIHEVALPTAVDQALTVTPAAGTELWLTGRLSGQGALTKAGDGRLRLSGANTYTGGTDVRTGIVDVAGSSPFGTGPVTFANNSGLAGKGDAMAVVPNAVLAQQGLIWIGAYAPVTLSGGWTASGDTVYGKAGSNEVTVAGSMQPSTGSKSLLLIYDGAVRFAAGANALFTHPSTRNSIDFSSPASASSVRKLTIETGAQVTAGCLYEGCGASNTVAVSGGSLVLQGAGGSGDALIFGTGALSTNRFELSGGQVTAADNMWSMLGVDPGVSVFRVTAGTASFGKVSFGVRDWPNNNVGALPFDTRVTIDGGLFEARQRWNWMGEMDGMRVNTVELNGGRLRLPATISIVSNRINQTRLVFNGGTLETPGGGTDPEDPANYLKGLKQATVGAGGAVIDTQGRSVTLAQRLTALGGVTDGGVVKRGAGTLTLAYTPCVTGRIDVQSGTLRLPAETGAAYPDDPLVRFSFENGIQADDSAYGKNAGTVLGTTNNLVLIPGKSGNNALRFNNLNALYVNYSDDMKGADSYTVSTWVRQSAYGSNNQRMTFFGTLDDYTKDQYDFLLRILNGDFRMLGTGQDNVDYGAIYADVTNAVPLNTWTLLTYVVDGLNGFSMYVNGVKRTMKVYNSGVTTYTNTFGAGKLWMFLPAKRIAGDKAFNIGRVTSGDADCFGGDLDDVTVYRRALSEPEIALLYQAKVPYGKRVRVQSGALLNLMGATQEVAEVTGEGTIGSGTAAVTGSLNPGDSPSSAAGALLTVTDNLTLGTNVTYICNWTPGANDLVDIWGKLTVNGAGTVDLGLTTPSQMPGSPRLKSFPVMYYSSIAGAPNFSQWKVKGIGRTATTATVTAADGVVRVNLEIPSGTIMLLK